MNEKSSKVLYEQSVYSIRCHFKIKKILGTGANGSVFLAKSKADKKLYAIKPLPKNDQSKNEINIHWSLLDTCLFILDLKALYSTNNHYYLILEYMDDGSLWDKLRNQKGKFTEKEVAKMIYQISKAVFHLHSRGIAHRDIKLENILCSKKEDDLILKLGDFGFAKDVNLGLFSLKYTPPYVAPEILSCQNYGIGCDVWSLGVVMFVLCCGYLPFSSSINKSMSDGMKNRIMSGDFEYMTKEWTGLSLEAKRLILGMLEIDPIKRLNISQVLESEWFNKVPDSDLNTLNNFKCLNFSDFNKELEREFKKMRDFNQNDLIPLDMSENILFQKRTIKLNTIKEQNENDCDENESVYDNLSQERIGSENTNLVLNTLYYSTNK